MRGGILAILFLTWLIVLPASVAAQQAPLAPPEKIAELVRILDDPAVRDWVEKQRATAAPVAEEDELRAGMRAWGLDARARLRALSSALPRVPGALAAVLSRIYDESIRRGLPPPVLIVGGIVLLALAGEWLSRMSMRRAPQRGHPVVVRTANEVVPVAIFALVALVIFVVIDWPPALDTVIFFYLLAAVSFRVVLALLAMAFTAGSITRRFYIRARVFSAILLFALATNAVARQMMVEADVGQVIALVFSLVLLFVCFETVWRDPSAPVRAKMAKSARLATLWLIWVLGLLLLFWSALYIVVLPRLLRAADRLAKAFAAARWADDPESSVPTVLAVRGVRLGILAIAIAWLAYVWQVNPRSIGRADTVLDAIFTGLLKSVIVVLIADLGWNIASAMINRKLAAVRSEDQAHGVEAARRARLKTLLPIFRNALAAVILVMTALMVLAELGVEIGPLIAGAGVIGVAVGFGSQTLVKDVISGVFYLMDDAFRVGEYIQSGSYKGTVESFSLRSVRLRHHRGPIFTVPFGVLGAVQNMSRDWAIDKFMLRVNFDTDIGKVKKLTKAIGAELKADPELGPLLIETLKMKGVEQIGEFGLEVSFAFTATPGNQSMIRRRAYTMLRNAFVENGIGFAQPTVQVGGDDKSDAAAAAHSLVQKQKAAAAAPLPPQDA